MIFHRHTQAIRKIGQALLKIGLGGDSEGDTEAIELLNEAVELLKDEN